MARAGLHADLAQAGEVAPFLERAFVALHVGVEFFRRGVLFTHLADLAAQADGDALGLYLADVLRDLGRARVVVELLLVERRRVERDEGAGVDVDVPETGRHRFLDQVLDFLDGALGVGLVLGGLDLEVVALDEERVEVAFLDGGGNDHRAVLGRRQLAVAHLAARDLEDERAGVGLLGGAQGGAGGVVGREADVHGRYGAILPLAAAAGDVELVDAGRPRTEHLADLPDHPAGVGLDRLGAEGGGASQQVDAIGLELGEIDDLDLVALDDDGSFQLLAQFISGFVNHFACLSDWKNERTCTLRCGSGPAPNVQTLPAPVCPSRRSASFFSRGTWACRERGAPWAGIRRHHTTRSHPRA